jgi:tetratricopeptide (TPR) repeat protein
MGGDDWEGPLSGITVISDITAPQGDISHTEVVDLVRRGERASRHGHQDEALGWFREAIARDPGDPRAWMGVGYALGKRGDYAEEVLCCDRALELAPDLKEAWVTRGFALGKLERYEEKIASCDQALQIDPDFAPAWNNRGHALGMLGRYEEEVECCRRATLLRPRYLSAWVNQGIALGKLKRYREEIVCYNRALRIFPGYQAAWVNKGVALCQIGKYEEALESFNRAEEVGFIGDRIAYWRGYALAKTGQPLEAIEILDAVVTAEPRHADAWVIMSNCYFTLGRLDESARCFRIAYDIDIHDVQVRIMRGISHFKAGRFDEGIGCISEIFGILAR